LLRNSLFSADIFRALAADTILFRQPALRILAVLEKKIITTAGGITLELEAGQFCLLPAALSEVALAGGVDSSFLLIKPTEESP
jgi:hypothetical protein